MDLKKYWAEVRAIERSLPDYVWMVSVADVLRGRVGDAMVEVGAAMAAKLLSPGRTGWRRRTGSAHKENQSAMKRAAIEEKLRKSGTRDRAGAWAGLAAGARR